MFLHVLTLVSPPLSNVAHCLCLDPPAIFTVIEHIFWRFHIVIVISLRFQHTKHPKPVVHKDAMFLFLLLHIVLELPIPPLALVSHLHWTRHNVRGILKLSNVVESITTSEGLSMMQK